MVKFSKRFSLEGWKLWRWLMGRKKLVVTVVGMLCAQLAFDPQLTGLLAGGAAFEGVWSVLEYYFKKVKLK